jgi:3-oxoacyl-[acyl-carrier protein] reductase
MVHEKSGKIINVSSMWGVCGASCEVHYSAAKSALIGLTKALARELAPSNIQVNCIAPGVIDTKMNASLGEETLELLKEESPMGRFGTPEEVTHLMLFLAGDGSDFITGQTIGIDGAFI